MMLWGQTKGRVPSHCVGEGSELGCRWVQGERGMAKMGAGSAVWVEGRCAMQTDILQERIDWRSRRNGSWARVF